MLLTHKTANRILMIVFAVFLFSSTAFADVIINVLAVNGKADAAVRKINFSLPGELTPEDIIDSATLTPKYSVEEGGYVLQGDVALESKETRTLRVKVKDVWSVTPEDAEEIRQTIEKGYKELGAEKNAENGNILRQRLLDKLEYILQEQETAGSDTKKRIDTYRSHVLSLREIKDQATMIDYWRTDAALEESLKQISFMVEIENPTDKPRTFKSKQPIPSEVRPEHIVDRQGYEIRYEENKKNAFLFKEEELAAKEKKLVRFGVKDVWFIQKSNLLYVRERSLEVFNELKATKYGEIAKTLFDRIVNNLDLIDLLQSGEQPDIKQHIAAYRINKQRFDMAKEDLDSLEKLLSRHRAELERSKIKNVMQKIRSVRSLRDLSNAIFDKKPKVNTAWTIIFIVMVFLAVITIIYFISSLIRANKDKKLKDIGSEEKSQTGQEPPAAG